ncbi:hydroxymethylbilane synthase [bacterium]|nr:hydroxymethylbilane synthase [bacterium]
MRIGTRGSALALTQAKSITEIITEVLGVSTEVAVIRTQGDRVTDVPFSELEGRGYFTREIEEALLDGQIDAAVHSFKDMPAKSPDGLAIAAVSERENPADMLIVAPGAYADIQSVPQLRDKAAIPLRTGAVVGTSAIRRAVQIKSIRPDIQIRDLRGNVPTRLEKLAAGEYDAIFLAVAGVKRLKLTLDEFKVVELDPAIFVPAPGQGALAVQMREDDPLFNEIHSLLHDRETGQATTLERKVLTYFGGGCGLPLGAYAEPTGNLIKLHGFWGGDTEHPVWAQVHGDWSLDLASELFEKLRI